MWLLHTLGCVSNCKYTITDKILYQWQHCDIIAILHCHISDTAELDHTGPSNEAKYHLFSL